MAGTLDGVGEVLTTKELSRRWGVKEVTLHVMARMRDLDGINVSASGSPEFVFSLDWVREYESRAFNSVKHMLHTERETLALALRIPNREKRLHAIGTWIDKTGYLIRDRFGLRFRDGTRCKHATVMAPRISKACGCHVSQRLCRDWMQSEWPGFLPLEAFEAKADSPATKAS